LTDYFVCNFVLHLKLPNADDHKRLVGRTKGHLAGDLCALMPKSMSANAFIEPEEKASGDPTASLVAYVVDAIIDGVTKRRYAPGQRLIAADLADEYGVSRAPVREALHMLAGEGVVELTPNRGARIRKLSTEQLVDFLEFTEAICTLGVRLATLRMREPDYRNRLESAYRALEDAWDKRLPGDFVVALYQYHIDVNEISENQFVDFFYRRPYIRFYTTLLADLVPGRHWEQYIMNYRLIHETILSGDPHAAVATFVSHIRWVLKIMRENQASGTP
jgi:DNA-binding GntR family transcriptional regulator